MVLFGDDSLKFLDEAPGKWTLLKKKTAQVKEKLASLQSQQVDKINQDQDVFFRKTQQFRSMFLSQVCLRLLFVVPLCSYSLREQIKLLRWRSVYTNFRVKYSQKRNGAT